MLKTFTQNDLVRSIYKETSKQEERDLAIQRMINIDLDNTYEEYQLVKEKLDSFSFEPSQNSIDFIMDYAKAQNSRKLAS